MKKYFSHREVTTQASAASAIWNFVLNSSALRAATVNGGRNEQGHISPGSATSLLWDLRQTLTSMGFNVCIYRVTILPISCFQFLSNKTLFSFEQNPSWKATI